MLPLGVIIILIGCGLPFGALYFAGETGMLVKEFAGWVFASKCLLGIGTLLCFLGAFFMNHPRRVDQTAFLARNSRASTGGFSIFKKTCWPYETMLELLHFIQQRP
jgi:hypothetical protein